jgi:carboxypeptidase family protein
MMLSNSCCRATTIVAVFLIVIVAMAVSAQQPTAAQVATGKLKGVVVDWQYARISRSCLIIRNKGFQTRVAVDEEGAFEFDLPAGTYEVFALSPGFTRVRRKNLRGESGTTTTSNFLLQVAPEVSGQCPANTIRRGDLCESLCETNLR